MYEENKIADQPFGFLADGPAGPLINEVRQRRAAQAAAAERTPTFGELGEERRAVNAEEQQIAADEPQAVGEAAIGGEIKFLVDTATGEFEPVLPGQADPQPGPSEILLTVDQENPSQPNILATGKRVTSADIARLGNPEKQIKPTLRSSFQLPPEFEGLAESLGVKRAEETPA